MPPSKKCRLTPRQDRIRSIGKEAARRTYNANGMNGSLPPLPCGDDDECDTKEGSGGLGTLFGHPYGALPYGNIHFSANADNVRHSGLGALRVLNDEQLIEALSYVDGPSLAQIALCSRFLYVGCHHDELWRDLTLRRWGECGFDVPTNADPVDVNTECTEKKQQHNGCWKDIYAYNYHKSYNQNLPNLPPPKHKPIPISGIYSDTFFRSWLCRSFALHPSWLSTHTVSTLPHSEVSTSKFLKEYEETNTPLLIKGASSSWPALKKWKTDYLIQVTEGKYFRATSGAAPFPAQFTLRDYANYCSSAAEEAPLYLFDRTFATKCPQLLKDFDPALRETCPFWSREAEHGHDLFNVLGEERRPDYQWLIVGPKRSGSCFHIDPNCTHAWNAPIIGRKRWIFYPPGVTPPGVFPSPNGDDVCMPISLGEWFLTFWDAHVERRNDPDITKRPLECTACPGDVLFVPHGWWHLVLNIGDDSDNADGGMSIALTRNYVSASNLSDVLRFLDTRVNQISGCRDRGEAVKPEELGREFREGLRSGNCPQPSVSEEMKEYGDECDGERRGTWADLLDHAEIDAKKGWGCAAWKDIDQNCSKACAATEETNETKTSILDRAKRTDDSNNVTSTQDAAGGFSFSFL